MAFLRAFVCGAALAVAVMPFSALAADTSNEHAQAELANAQAQLNLADQQVADLEQLANQSAANERMIALLRSQALREQQLNNAANGLAMEQIATALADAARASGDQNASNELGIAQIKAAALIATADANLANAQMLAFTRGRADELANAHAQSNLLHQLADFITGQQAAINMSNAREIAQEEAAAIQMPAIAQEENSIAMGADELLAADTELQAGNLAALSSEISISSKAADVLGHAAASLANARAMAAAAS